jgi:hypothetical protein
VLLLALIVGDQIRINRPDHKYRLSLEVMTPEGVKNASGVFSVHPDRGYSRGGKTRTKGDAISLDLGSGKLLLVLLAIEDVTLDTEEINYLAVRAFTASGQRAVFKQMDRLKGSAPVPEQYRPVLASLSDPFNPTTMRAVNPADLAAAFGPGVRFSKMMVEIVPNGLWPIDFGGVLGEPVTRGIGRTLPWLDSQGSPDISAIVSAGWKLKPGAQAAEVFTRD